MISWKQGQHCRWEITSPKHKCHVCTCVGGTNRKLIPCQYNFQHWALLLLLSTPFLHSGFSLPRSQVASIALISSLCKHHWDILLHVKYNCFLKRTDKTTAANFLLFKSSSFFFLFINIYTVYSESFCIHSNFKNVLDMNNFYIWETV